MVRILSLNLRKLALVMIGVTSHNAWNVNHLCHTVTICQVDPPDVVPVSINVSKREKDGVSSLETQLYNVYATFIPTLVRSELDERT